MLWFLFTTSNTKLSIQQIINAIKGWLSLHQAPEAFIDWAENTKGPHTIAGKDTNDSQDPMGSVKREQGQRQPCMTVTIPWKEVCIDMGSIQVKI